MMSSENGTLPVLGGCSRRVKVADLNGVDVKLARSRHHLAALQEAILRALNPDGYEFIEDETGQMWGERAVLGNAG